MSYEAHDEDAVLSEIFGDEFSHQGLVLNTLDDVSPFKVIPDESHPIKGEKGAEEPY